MLLLVSYLALDRFRRDRLTALAIALAAPLALCANPAGLRTFSYLHGLLTNVAAARGAGCGRRSDPIRSTG